MLSPSTFFTDWKKKHFKLHMKSQEKPHSQDNPKQSERSQKQHTAGLQTILQGYSNQNSMYRYQNRDIPMEQNRNPRSNTTYLQPADL